MRKILLIIPFLFLACSDDEDPGCKCRGEFTRINNTENSFFADGVDCETGQPVLDQQNQGDIGVNNPAIYLGCAN